MKAAQRLRELLEEERCHVMPCCFDALSARLISQEGFDLTFMSGFAASASRIGAPDLGLMSYGEVIDQARNITESVEIPLIADGDTGYGNAMNVRRTVTGFARAGCAAVMIEDQLSPKRCGHTPGKSVVGRDEAFDRIRAAVDAREAAREKGHDIMILARTDARHEHGLKEAIYRADKFAQLGADILFVEAPRSEEEMRSICVDSSLPQMANIVEGGHTPDLPNEQLHDIGYSIAAYPLTLLSAAMQAMVNQLKGLRSGHSRDGRIQHDACSGNANASGSVESERMSFMELRRRLGFEEYYDTSANYETSRRSNHE